MMLCRTAQFFFSLLPVTAIRDLLLRHHIQTCPRCQESLISQSDILSSLVMETDLQDLAPMWPSVRSRLDKKRRQNKPIPLLRWRWGYTGLTAVFLLVAVIFILVFFSNGDFQIMLESGFKVHYARIENKPAQTLFYQPQDSNMIIIWVEKNHEREMNYE